MNIAYFNNGELYDVSPFDSNKSIFDNREIAYRADIIVSDGVTYDLSNIQDISVLPIPAFSPSIPAVLEMSYILKIRCGIVDDVNIIPVIVPKTIDMMLMSPFMWRDKDYLQVIRNFHRVGLIREGTEYKNSFLAKYGSIDEKLKNDAQIAAFAMSLNCDAVEISAHGCCSIDHEPIQGRIFLKTEFEKMQSGKGFMDIEGNCYAPIMRPIGSNGCLHFVTGCSKSRRRIYTDKMLEEMYNLNHSKVIVDDKEYERHEVCSFMREIEEQITKEKETAVMAMDNNDMETRKICQHCINELAEQYYKLVRASGLKSRMDKTHIPGFRKVDI